MIKLTLLLMLLAQPEPPCKRHALEQGSGTVLVCKAGVL